MRRTLFVAISLLVVAASRGAASPVGDFAIESSSRSVSSAHLRIQNLSESISVASTGPFDESVSVGDVLRRSMSATQQSDIEVTGSSLLINGVGSATATRIATAGASERQRGESLLDIEFTASRNSFYTLAGRLTVQPDVPMPLPHHFDDSSSFVEFVELGNSVLLASNGNGPFTTAGFLYAGRNYRLRIGSTIFLQTTDLFNKTNGWELSFSATPVPEPTALATGVVSLVGLAALRRRK